jgi:hypothetical protein
VGSTTTGYLKLVITSQVLKGDMGEDGMTEVSGMTGLTSVVHELPEQDLSGGRRLRGQGVCWPPRAGWRTPWRELSRHQMRQR